MLIAISNANHAFLPYDSTEYDRNCHVFFSEAIPNYFAVASRFRHAKSRGTYAILSKMGLESKLLVVCYLRWEWDETSWPAPGALTGWGTLYSARPKT